MRLRDSTTLARARVDSSERSCTLNIPGTVRRHVTLRLWACRRERAPLGFAALASLAAACGGEQVVLGAGAPLHFGEAVLVAELVDVGRSENPTLTQDLRELYFTADRPDASLDTGGNVWFASRATRDLPFAPAVPVSEVNTGAFETSSAVSADGLTLWIGSDRPGGRGDLDVWRSTRTSRTEAWSSPVNVTELNTPARDLPRPLGDHGRTMPLSSERAAAGRYQTFLAVRASATAPFATPQPIPELTFSDRSAVDAFLTDDGLMLLYSSGAPLEPADLYVAVRSSADEPFSNFAPIDDINTQADERDPWLSLDGSTLFFASDRGRDGVMNIYQASAIR